VIAQGRLLDLPRRSDGQYRQSTHGQLAAKGSPDAPDCSGCHGNPRRPGENRLELPDFSAQRPHLCGQATAPARSPPSVHRKQEHHRRELYGKHPRAGTTCKRAHRDANCADCHTRTWNCRSDARSSVTAPTWPPPAPVPPRHSMSDSSRAFTRHLASSSKPLPSAATATPPQHRAHRPVRFRLAHHGSMRPAATPAITASYFETYQRQISKLGYLKTAKCYDLPRFARRTR